MAKYKIPVVWQMMGYIEVEAETPRRLVRKSKTLLCLKGIILTNLLGLTKKV
jgi:hypothetical protein